MAPDDIAVDIQGCRSCRVGYHVNAPVPVFVAEMMLLFDIPSVPAPPEL